ncbi:MAG: MBL fold metallo-hydrolase [Halobacteriota archaeon]
MTDVVRITVGEGSPEGANSAYLLSSHGTIVDPGPPGDDRYERLRAGVSGAGVDIEAVDHVVLTHWHADHVGLAARLAADADATIHMHEQDAPLFADYAAARARRLQRDASTLTAWGVPADRVAAVRRGDAPSPFPDTIPVECHADGDSIAGGTLVHTPGHTAGHSAVRFGDALFVGDAVLPTYTPNVGGTDTRMDDPLSAYVRSIRDLRRHTGDSYPGHGSSIDVQNRVREILEHHRTRSRRTIRHLEDRTVATPWEIAGDLFGSMRGIHVKLGAGEAAAHLEFLCTQSYVERIDDDPHRYRVIDRPDADASHFDVPE